MNVFGEGTGLDRALAQALCRFYGCEADWFTLTVMATSQALQEGHSCLFLPDWAGRGVAGSAVGSTLPSLDDWLQQLAALPLEPGRNTPLVLDGERLYLRRYWQFEQNLAAALRPRLQTSPVAHLERARAVLDTLFPPRTVGEPPDWQKVAAANALLQAFTVVAGGPGTGKTYTVTRLLACLIACLPIEHDAPLVIRMAAPTGKAAQRLAESIAAARTELAGLVPAAVLSAIPDSGTTLHRLLGVVRNRPGFRHNASNPLQLDVLVVDEASMVDLPLMTRLFQALPARCRVILLGDPDQLPSVAAGSVLADLAALAPCDYSAQRLAALAGLGVTLDAAEPGAVEANYLTTLRQSRRFDASGGIGELARQVLAGDGAGSLQTLTTAGDVLALQDRRRSAAAVTRWLDTHYRPIAEARCLDDAFQALQRFRILCPARGGPWGVDAINRVALARMNPAGLAHYCGKPIMITRNHHDLGLYNGDVGLLWPDDDGQLLAWFPVAGGFRPMAPGRLPEHELVYAMTIHKTQGSEFDRVALVLPEQPSAGLTRELLYTAITRARNALEVVASESVWSAAVAQRVQRDSGLAALLQLE